MRKLFVSVGAVTLAILLVLWPTPASGQKKEVIELQRDVVLLQQQVRDLQQSFDRNQAVLKTLVEQTLDAVKFANEIVTQVEKSVQNAQANTGARVDALTGQVQALRDTVDELSARLARVSQQLAETQNVMQSVDARLAGSPPVPGETPGGPVSGGQPPSPAESRPGGASMAPPSGTERASRPPSATVLYDNAMRDYINGNYELAQQQFADYLRYYRRTELADNAQFYLGEILYKNGDYPGAIQAYDKVLAEYSSGNKVPAALLKKGYALLELKQRAAGVQVLRTLIERHPTSEQAPRARAELLRLGEAPPAN